MAKQTFNKLAISNLDDFIYGSAPKPVTTKSGMVIGGGTLYPELNFTLPGMNINEKTIDKAQKIYANIVKSCLKRAAELEVPGILLEFETVPDYTVVPKYAIDANRILLDGMKEAADKYGLKTALRMTPNDNREMSRPPVMRSGPYCESMLEVFETCAADGTDFLSIESTGGKEVSDDAIIMADIRKAIFAVGVLGCRDMRFLWSKIVSIADKYDGSYAAGDTACGFANTAMVLAEKNLVPRVFGAVFRVMCVPRSLCAVEEGAVGPTKDCGYENPHIKAISGVPVSAEGRMAACAHFSAVGNIASCVADCWSNESVQQVKLLSDMAPVVSVEQLAYDCRMFNKAKEKGFALQLRDIMADSDAALDPHAWIFKPDVVLRTAAEIVKEKTDLMRTKVAAKVTICELRSAIASGSLRENKGDIKWLDRMDKAIDSIPDDDLEFYEQMRPELDFDKFLPEEYDLPK